MTNGMILFSALLAPNLSVELQPPPSGFTLRAPDLFRVEKAAGDELAHDIYTITLDASGRVLVSGPGYIRVLHDRDGDGRFEAASDFWRGPASGCQGMVFHGESLYTTGGGGLERYDDRDGDGAADGPPVLLLPLAGGEHGAHALRVGPDGFLYFLGGNHCALPRGRVNGFSPIPEFYAGVFCRMDLRAGSIEVWADGMRNAYDFDFATTGDVFGWDSDSERTEGLPWYRPCRLYHFTPGASCGWRGMGTGEMPRGALDTVEPAAEVHRGSPTGVACLRHDAIPERYRGGLLALDWTFGRVYFFRPLARGASFAAVPEVFFSASGDVSFAPTDVALQPDGTILITSGGRGIEGSVLRVSAVERPGPPDAPRRPLDDVLLAPDPFSAWSRARWKPVARALGVEAFLAEVRGGQRPAGERLRALEIVLELFPADARRAVELAGAAHQPAGLRAAVARWAGVFAGKDAVAMHLADLDLRVRREAVESAMRLLARDDGESLAPLVLPLGREPDARLRHAAAAALSGFVRGAPAARVKALRPASAGERLVLGFALVRAAPRGSLCREAVDLALEALDGAAPAADDIASGALRLVQAAFDRLKAREDPDYSTFDPEWERVDLEPHREIVARILGVSRRFLDGSGLASAEAMRLSAKLHDPSPMAASGVAAKLGESTPAAGDMLAIWCLSQLAASLDEPAAARVIAWAAGFPDKLQRQRIGRDEKWGIFQRAIWERLLSRHPELGAKLVDDARFGDAEHLDCISGAGRDVLARAAARIFERGVAGSLSAAGPARGRLLELLVEHLRGDAKARLVPILRESLDDPVLRATALEGLARDPAPEDRGRFLEALAERDPSLLRPAIDGLDRLPPASDTGGADGAEEVLALVAWASASQPPSRDLVAARLEKLTGKACGYRKTQKVSQKESPRESQSAAIECWVEWFKDRYPDQRGALDEALRPEVEGAELVESLLKFAPWGEGDPARGKLVFEARSCGSCHHLGGTGQRVGPDLAGAGRRLGLKELLTEIVDPSRIVPERYGFTEYVLKGGERVQGIEIYTSREALVTVTREGKYRRIDPAEIEGKTPQTQSLMPNGLLSGLEPKQVADLVAYLKGF